MWPCIYGLILFLSLRFRKKIQIYEAYVIIFQFYVMFHVILGIIIVVND